MYVCVCDGIRVCMVCVWGMKGVVGGVCVMGEGCAWVCPGEEKGVVMSEGCV